MVAMVGHGGFALSPGHGGNGRQWWVFLWVFFFFFWNWLVIVMVVVMAGGVGLF